VCGGPRVPADVAGLARSDAELASLVRAKRLRAMAFGWTAAALMLALSAMMALGLAGLLALVARLPALLMGALGAGAAALALGMRGRAKKRDAEAQGALELAWESVADEVLRARGRDVTAKELAALMRTDEARAERMLASLAAKDRARVEIDEDAELRYAPQLRIADDAGATEDARSPEDADERAPEQPAPGERARR